MCSESVIALHKYSRNIKTTNVRSSRLSSLIWDNRFHFDSTTSKSRETTSAGCTPPKVKVLTFFAIGSSRVYLVLSQEAISVHKTRDIDFTPILLSDLAAIMWPRPYRNIYMYIHICIYTHTHIHTYVNFQSKFSSLLFDDTYFSSLLFKETYFAIRTVYHTLDAYARCLYLLFRNLIWLYSHVILYFSKQYLNN